jgi:PBP1b-binding outer membrane lipoprotein LpoB
MMLVGNQMVDAQIEILANVSTFLINRLGSGNMEEARKACTDSLADQITSAAVQGGVLPKEQSKETSEAIGNAIREWAEKLMDGNNEGDNNDPR